MEIDCDQCGEPIPFEDIEDAAADHAVSPRAVHAALEAVLSATCAKCADDARPVVEFDRRMVR